MKKSFLVVFTSALCAALLSAGVASSQDLVNVGSLKGPTSIGLVGFMDEEAKEKDQEYSFTMLTAADELSAKFMSGEVDFALIPANMASILYNKTGGNVQVVDINTLGVLYLVTADEEVDSVADLKGKTVYTTGKGQTPEYVLNYLLKANGLAEEDVTVEYKSEATEVVSMLSKDTAAIGVLPQPFATVACQQNESLKLSSDLTQEWDSTGNGSLVTGVTVVKKEFAEANPDRVEDFLEEHEDSVEFVNENVSAAAELVVSCGIIEKAPVAEKAIPKCNITCIDEEEMKTALSGYLEALYEQNPESIGGALPGDDFYYIEKDD